MKKGGYKKNRSGRQKKKLKGKDKKLLWNKKGGIRNNRIETK